MKIAPAKSLLCTAFLAISGTPAAAAPLDFITRPVDLHTEDETINSVGGLDYLGDIEIRSRNPRFGGLSGLSVAPDGTRLFMVTDKGWWVTLQAIYNQSGRLVGAQKSQIGKLLTPSGKPIAYYRRALVVSFEIVKKMFLYPAGKTPLASRPRALRTPAAPQGAPSNGEIEALTTLHGGRIFALTERFAHGYGVVIGWFTQNRAWHRVLYKSSGEFYPTGAATLPNGDILLLERWFNWIAGVASRIARISTDGIIPGALIESREIAVLDPPLVVENFEAIDVRTGPKGETLVYILSDDNFQRVQRNLLLMFRLKQVRRKTR